MAERTGKGLALGTRLEPQVLANIPPTVGQRRTAIAFAFILLAIFGGTLPFVTISLPKIDAFVPSLAAALLVTDCVAAVLLFSQFWILRQSALLILANGYLFSALAVVAHALAFPGAFEPFGRLGIQSAVWLYWFWHLGFPLSVIGYALLKDTGRTIGEGTARSAICLSIAGLVAAVVGVFWAVIQFEHLLPVTFVDVRPISLFRQKIGGVSIFALGGLALGLLWLRRRSLLDQWLLVALCAFLLEVLLASVLSGARYTLGWYGGRFYQFVTAAVVTVVLLLEMTKLYTHLARSNVMLQNERNNKIMTLEVMAASISHEVRQPLAAIATRGDTALRILSRPPADLEKLRSILTAIVSESGRASKVFDDIRSLFLSANVERQAVDLNEIALGALRILRAELEDHRIVLRIDLMSDLPLTIAHSGQVQEVILNLVQNAIEAMDTIKSGIRILHVRTERSTRDAIAVTIEDSGPGIDPERIGEIFDPFVTTKFRGMGLGLAICRMAVERHGGQLSASPGKIRGALFRFTLPIVPVETTSFASL